MALYMLLIHEQEGPYATAEGFAEAIETHATFGDANAGVIRGGNALEPASTASFVRRDPSGGFGVTDGAFVETKEVLGGYYLIEVADEAAAIEVAKQLPAPFGEIEVRKVRAHD